MINYQGYKNKIYPDANDNQQWDVVNLLYSRRAFIQSLYFSNITRISYLKILINLD